MSRAISVGAMGISTGLPLFANGQRIRADDESQADDLHADSSKNENYSRIGGYEKNNGGHNDDPSSEQHQESRKLHAPLFTGARQRRGVSAISHNLIISAIVYSNSTEDVSEYV